MPEDDGRMDEQASNPSEDHGQRRTVKPSTPAHGNDGGAVGLAELVAALSLGIDLGFGQPMEHVLRQCWIALRIAEEMGLD
jgi:hypothetical protein